MGKPKSPNILYTCILCGDKFHPTSSRQKCCGKDIVKVCVVCGKEFPGKCTVQDTKETCSSECQVVLSNQRKKKSAGSSIRKCKWCGKEFTPTSERQLYCNDIHYQVCLVCGKKFEIDVRKDQTVKTCSDKCRYILASRNKDIATMKDRLQHTMMEKYGVENAMQLPEFQDKIKQTNKEKYGSEWYTQTEEYRQAVKATDLEKYGVDHHLKSKEVIEKRTETVRERYGSDNIFSSEFGKRRVRSVLMKKYGIENPSQNPEIKAKATRNSRRSNLEKRIESMLVNYGIEFQHHYHLRSGKYGHEFDFYLPKHKVLIDADGLYYHSYLEDPDGERVRDDYDEVRLHLVPKDHMFCVLIEENEERQLRELMKFLNNNVVDCKTYDSALFKWCRSIEFPYPNYTDKRLQNDWNHLKQYRKKSYVPHCRIGESIIKQFHRSIYDAHVGNYASPKEGWYDDKKLKRVIANRLIYKNDVDPSKVLAGFNISKECPTVSMFNPILARYLTKKYLSEFTEVFDPFSGYSGRMLGVVSTGRRYIGQDINSTTIKESTQIKEYLKLTDSECLLSEKDILLSDGKHQCLLTCPPYYKKETYGTETIFKTCDKWIDECLTRFDCRRYVFVVNETEKFNDNVKEELKSNSHFSHTTELVIVIDK